MIRIVRFDGKKGPFFASIVHTVAFKFHIHYEYCCVWAGFSQPNFTLNWPYAFTNAIQCAVCVCVWHTVHVWSIPSRHNCTATTLIDLKFINLMPFRFHFVSQKFRLPRVKWNLKPIHSHKAFIKIMQFRLISHSTASARPFGYAYKDIICIFSLTSHRVQMGDSLSLEINRI